MFQKESLFKKPFKRDQLLLLHIKAHMMPNGKEDYQAPLISEICQTPFIPSTPALTKGLTLEKSAF